MVYKDADGWLYKVMPTEKGYQTHCKRDREWVAFFLFRPKETETEAQAELDEMAYEEGWEKYEN